ncbi:MAG: hypothetical protein ACJ788_25790 [Ktedonobacteraceae bacterium]
MQVETAIIRRDPIMNCNKFIWSWAREADQSALGAVNRPVGAGWV